VGRLALCRTLVIREASNEHAYRRQYGALFPTEEPSRRGGGRPGYLLELRTVEGETFERYIMLKGLGLVG
jgi:hypothetical protein